MDLWMLYPSPQYCQIRNVTVILVYNLTVGYVSCAKLQIKNEIFFQKLKKYSIYSSNESRP